MDSILSQILSGNAKVKIHSKKTGTTYTYKVSQKGEGPHFVALLSGGYKFLGSIFGRKVYRTGKKSTVSAEAPEAKAWAWMWDHLSKGLPLPPVCGVTVETKESSASTPEPKKVSNQMELFADPAKPMDVPVPNGMTVKTVRVVLELQPVAG